jgi:CDP-6-deoxy-D-xylo-4-hexulose-3-dehydrase
MGEGGAVYTNNPLLKKIMLSMRDWGRDCWCDSGVDDTCGCRFSGQFGTLPEGYDHKSICRHFGYNLKITDMQAAIGCAQLKKFPAFVEKRKENFRVLYSGLMDADQLQLFKAIDGADPSWFGFLITLTDSASFTRNEMVGYLESRNIQTRTLFAGNLTRHPCFDELNEDVDYRIIGDLKNTDKIMSDSFWVGLYPGMGQEKLQYMIQSIEHFCRR